MVFHRLGDAEVATNVGDRAFEPLVPRNTDEPGAALCDPTTFEASRKRLAQSARQAAEAARASDVDAFTAAYTVMDATCITCHKRYAPNY